MNNTADKESRKETLRTLIERACKDIFYQSETDAPVEPFSRGNAAALTIQMMLEKTGKSERFPAEEMDAEKFFDRVTKINDWYSDAQAENARKFAFLIKLLAENLGDLRVFKIGKIQIDIYVVGIDDEENLAGVTTKAVET